jgi:hypothetical protein
LIRWCWLTATPTKCERLSWFVFARISDPFQNLACTDLLFTNFGLSSFCMQSPRRFILGPLKISSRELCSAVSVNSEGLLRIPRICREIKGLSRRSQAKLLLNYYFKVKNFHRINLNRVNRGLNGGREVGAQKWTNRAFWNAWITDRM